MGVGVCHCRDCQKASGGGPNYVALAPKTAFEIAQGEARVHFSKCDSGEEAGRAFCANCGTLLWSLSARQFDMASRLKNLAGLSVVLEKPGANALWFFCNSRRYSFAR